MRGAGADQNVLLQRRGQVGDPITTFVHEMNQLATAFGMRKTRFVAPDDRAIGRSVTKSTASDLARLSIKLADDTGFKFYSKQRSRTVTVHKANGSQMRYIVKNSNSLLGSKVTGLKMAQGAGQHAAILSDKLPYRVKKIDGTEEVTPVQLITVLIGSANSKAVTQQLVAQGWGVYEKWRKSGYLAYPDRRGFIKVP